MSLLNQKTLNETFTFKGIGLHSGKVSTVNILPSGPNTGIIIRRTDIKKNNTIVPSIFNVFWFSNDMMNLYKFDLIIKKQEMLQ